MPPSSLIIWATYSRSTLSAASTTEYQSVSDRMAPILSVSVGAAAPVVTVVAAVVAVVAAVVAVPPAVVAVVAAVVVVVVFASAGSEYAAHPAADSYDGSGDAGEFEEFAAAKRLFHIFFHHSLPVSCLSRPLETWDFTKSILAGSRALPLLSRPPFACSNHAIRRCRTSLEPLPPHLRWACLYPAARQRTGRSG